MDFRKRLNFKFNSKGKGELKMAENERKINRNMPIEIIWFFVGVMAEWFAVMIQKGNDWEKMAYQYPDACGAAGIGGWTLLIFFVLTLIALVIYLVTELYKITTESNSPKIEIIGKNMEK